MHSGDEKSFGTKACPPLLFSINSQEYVPLPIKLSLPLVPVIVSIIVYPLKLSMLDTNIDKLSIVSLNEDLEVTVITYGDFISQIYNYL